MRVVGVIDQAAPDAPSVMVIYEPPAGWEPPDDWHPVGSCLMPNAAAANEAGLAFVADNGGIIEIDGTIA